MVSVDREDGDADVEVVVFVVDGGKAGRAAIRSRTEVSDASKERKRGKSLT